MNPGLQADSRIPATRARPDISFCLPVAVHLNHTDYARLVNVVLHGIALGVVMTFLPLLMVLPIILLGCCSLRYGLLQQAVPGRYRSLVCDHTGQWYLVAEDQRRQWIELELLQLLGPLLFIKLRHFGGTVYWITAQRQQSPSQWGRLRVLCRLL